MASQEHGPKFKESLVLLLLSLMVVPTNQTATNAAAASVHAAQPTITVFAAGIRNFDRTELDVIASSPSSRFVITIPNFNSEEVERLRQALLQETCQGICSNTNIAREQGNYYIEAYIVPNWIRILQHT